MSLVDKELNLCLMCSCSVSDAEPLENTYKIRGYIAYVQTSRLKDTSNIFRMFVDSSALSDQCPLTFEVFPRPLSAHIFSTRIQTGTICQMITRMVAYYSNLMAMAMTLDSSAYLKNNDGNAHKYYLRSAVDQYLFTYSIF